MWRGTLTRGATLPSRGVPAPRRIAAVAVSLAVALAPAAARAQDGAGDEQYTDPFAGQSQSDTVIEGRHLGACKPGQQPGDLTTPTGQTINIRNVLNGKK